MVPDVEESAILQSMLAARQPRALELLYHYARLLEVVLERKFGTRLCAEDRRDIVADALIHAWQTGDRFNPRLSSLKSWLIMIAIFQAREFLRRTGDDSVLPIDAVQPPVCSMTHDVGGDEEPSPTLQRLLAKLPERRRRVL